MEKFYFAEQNNASESKSFEMTFFSNSLQIAHLECLELSMSVRILLKTELEHLLIVVCKGQASSRSCNFRHLNAFS